MQEQEQELLTKQGYEQLKVDWLKEQKHGIGVNHTRTEEIKKGALLVSNWEQGTEEEPLYMTYNRGVFSFLRGHNHVNDSYREENHLLDSLYGDLKWALDDLWGKAEDDPRQDYKNAIKRVIKHLKWCRDDLKVESLEIAFKSIIPYDSQNRFNSTAHCFKIWASSDKLEERQQNTHDIRQAIQPRKLIAIERLDELLRLEEKVGRHIDHLFREVKRNKMTDSRAEDAKKTFRQDAEQLKQVYLRPFGPIFSGITRDLLQGCKDLNPTNVPEHFQIARQRVELLRLYRELESVYKELSLSGQEKIDSKQTQKLQAEIDRIIELMNDLLFTKKTHIAEAYLKTASKECNRNEVQVKKLKEILGSTMQALV